MEKLRVLNLTPEKFVEICETRISHIAYPDSTLLSVIEMINSLNDFESFVQMLKRRHAELQLSISLPSNSVKKRLFLLWDIENLDVPRSCSVFDIVLKLKHELTQSGDLVPGVSTYMECYHNPRGRGALSSTHCRDLVRSGVGIIDIGIQVLFYFLLVSSRTISEAGDRRQAH